VVLAAWQVVCRLSSSCGQWLAAELQECGDAGDPQCTECSLSLPLLHSTCKRHGHLWSVSLGMGISGALPYLLTHSRVAGAVSHSGDMLRTVLCQGTHSIAVNLAALSPAVCELFITMSSYCGRLKARLTLCLRLKCLCCRLAEHHLRQCRLAFPAPVTHDG